MAKEKKENLENIRHSLAHILAAAVLKKFPGAKLGIGPAIENGFYYDFLFQGQISPDILPELEKIMEEIIKQNLSFSGKTVTKTKAIQTFKDQLFKLDLIREFTKSKNKKSLKIYKTGEIFFDLCKGGHVKNTGEINPDAFKLTHIAGAYWRGDEKNQMLTRIYGVAFDTKKELDAHLKMLKEAKKRDHKILGKKLDLFHFSELVGSGLPLFTPKGTILRDSLDSFVWELRKERGYQRVDIPHITKNNLYITSGHWEKFKDELFKIKTREGHLFAMKPMNCPHHIQIFQRKLWSYKELPVRYASTTKVYRDEQTGELSGINRVRSITQDDAHSFCRKAQIKQEVKSIFEIVEKFYKTLGFKIEVHLSAHNPKNMEKYLGSPKIWKDAETILGSAIKEKKYKAITDLGEAAFYGPKIDFIGYDSLGRKLQLATIQLDMNMPERFNLTCVDEKGKKEKILIIHAAIMGSIERFLSGYIEHTAGVFPVWIAPVQVKILPVGKKFISYAEKIKDSLDKENIRVEVDSTDETLGKRIRASEIEKIPYILVVGEKEQKKKTVNVRHYKKGVLGDFNVSKLISKLISEIKQKTI